MLTEFVTAFRFLGSNPAAGHRREDLAESRPILFWPMRDYLILYKPSTKPLQILAVFHGSRDLPLLINHRQL